MAASSGNAIVMSRSHSECAGLAEGGIRGRADYNSGESTPGDATSGKADRSNPTAPLVWDRKGRDSGLLSEDLVDKAFADMCARRGVAPSDLMKTLEEKGIRLDTLRKHLRAEVARERLVRMQCRRNCEDRLDHPLVPKK
jgi:hypothetical protein